MATEMSAQGSSKVGNFLQQSTAGLPNWAWILVVAVGVAGAIIVPKFFNKGTSSTAPTTSGMDNTNTGLGLAVDPTTGLPYAVEGLQPSGAFAGMSSSTTAPSLPAASTDAFTTNQQIQSGPGAGYPDIPIRDKPGGNVIGTLGFGQRLSITGTPVSGPNNFGQGTPSGTGSTLWYPVEGGWISAFDVTKGAGSTGPMWPFTPLRSKHHMGV